MQIEKEKDQVYTNQDQQYSLQQQQQPEQQQNVQSNQNSNQKQIQQEEEYKQINPQIQQQQLQQQQKLPSGIYSWGLCKHGAQGNGKTDDSEIVPKRISSIKDQITQISLGGYYGLGLNPKGELYVWGNVKKGRTGVEKNEDIMIPQKLVLKQPIIQIACGNWHSIALSVNKQIFVTGHNGYGALGLNDHADRSTFTLVDELQNIEQVSAGDGFSCIINSNQELLTCGHRSRHGHAVDQNILSFQKIKNLTNIIQVNCGFVHACAINQAGQVFSWGNGDFYQLGHGTKQSEKTPKLITQLQNIAVKQVSCSRGEKNCHSACVDANGQVFTWGGGYKGKLGHYKEWAHDNPADEPLPKLIENIKQVKMKKVVCGGIHTCALSEDGQVYTFGCGSDGRLGHPEFSKYVYLYREGFPRIVDNLNGSYVTDIASSYYHSAALIQQ